MVSKMLLEMIPNLLGSPKTRQFSSCFFLGGGFKYCFFSPLKKKSNLAIRFLQLGWFIHQLVLCVFFFLGGGVRVGAMRS